MLIREIRPGESLRIGDAVVTLVKKSGQAARLCINAPAYVKVASEKDKKPAPTA